jgi:hypothetical protein
MDKASIAGYQNFNAVFFRRPQQLAILQIAPSHEGNGDDLMIAKRTNAGS